MAKRRRVANLLALAVLTLLAERPMHPYEMATVLRERGKHLSIPIKWGSLYTVVANLDKHGLAQASATTRRGRRPERTVYTISDAGRAELRDWLRELISVPEKEYRRFEAALSEIGALAPDEAAGLLAQRARALDEMIERARADLAAAATLVPRLFLIEGEYEIAMHQAEADWVRALLAEFTAVTLPGLAQWRQFHEQAERS